MSKVLSNIGSGRPGGGDCGQGILRKPRQKLANVGLVRGNGGHALVSGRQRLRKAVQASANVIGCGVFIGSYYQGILPGANRKLIEKWFP